MRPVTRSPASKPDEPVNEPGSTVDLLLGGVRTFLLKGLRGVSEETYSDGMAYLLQFSTLND